MYFIRCEFGLLKFIFFLDIFFHNFNNNNYDQNILDLYYIILLIFCITYFAYFNYRRLNIKFKFN